MNQQRVKLTNKELDVLRKLTNNPSLIDMVDKAPETPRTVEVQGKGIDNDGLSDISNVEQIQDAISERSLQSNGRSIAISLVSNESDIERISIQLFDTFKFVAIQDSFFDSKLCIEFFQSLGTQANKMQWSKSLSIIKRTIRARRSNVVTMMKDRFIEFFYDSRNISIEEYERPQWIELNRFLKLRKDKQAFQTFVDTFVSCVIHTRRYQKLKCVDLFGDYCTESTEAFTLLVLESNWARWQEMAIHRIDYINNHQLGDRYKPKIVYDNKPLYTSQDLQCTRWSREGKLRFQELIKVVKKNRKWSRAIEVENEMLRKNQMYQENMKTVKGRRDNREEDFQIDYEVEVNDSDEDEDDDDNDDDNKEDTEETTWSTHQKDGHTKENNKIVAL